MELPWLDETDFAGWDIVGMNHYHVDGERRLFVAMTKDGRCVKAEGPDDSRIWHTLANEVEYIECHEKKPSK